MIASTLHGINVRIPFGEYFKWENNIVICMIIVSTRTILSHTVLNLAGRV